MRLKITKYRNTEMSAQMQQTEQGVLFCSEQFVHWKIQTRPNARYTLYLHLKVHSIADGATKIKKKDLLIHQKYSPTVKPFGKESIKGA